MKSHASCNWIHLLEAKREGRERESPLIHYRYIQKRLPEGRMHSCTMRQCNGPICHFCLSHTLKLEVFILVLLQLYYFAGLTHVSLYKCWPITWQLLSGGTGSTNEECLPLPSLSIAYRLAWGSLLRGENMDLNPLGLRMDLSLGLTLWDICPTRLLQKRRVVAAAVWQQSATIIILKPSGSHHILQKAQFYYCVLDILGVERHLASQSWLN